MILLFIKSIAIILLTISSILGLGIGLYKAVEYVEDKAYAAKKYIRKIIVCISLFHIVLLFRGVSMFLVLFSLIIQFCFYTLLDSYPDISPSNPTFIGGSCMALVNHFLMLRAMISNEHYIVEMIIVFIFVVWMTPFCFFLSLSANDETFPTKGKRKRTWIGSLLKGVIKESK